MDERRRFRWRTVSLRENIWTSAVLSVFAAIAITAFSEIIVGPRFSHVLSHEYTWITLIVLFLVLFITRMPKRGHTPNSDDGHIDSKSD